MKKETVAMPFKKYGAITILFGMIYGLFNYGEPVFRGIGVIVAVSSKFNSAEASIRQNSGRIDSLEQNVNAVASNVREFRSVWCLDLLSKKNVNQKVLETCTKWINSP